MSKTHHPDKEGDKEEFAPIAAAWRKVQGCLKTKKQEEKPIIKMLKEETRALDHSKLPPPSEVSLVANH